MVLVFGLIQIVIGARIVLLLLDAREANALVSAILDISQVFVAPFEGILRTDSLNAAGSILDITAIVALVGWTILELIVLWVIGIFRRRSVTAIRLTARGPRGGRVNLRSQRDPPRAGSTRKEQLHGNHRLDRPRRARRVHRQPHHGRR